MNSKKLQSEIKEIESLELQKVLDEVNMPIEELKEFLKEFKK